MAHSFRPVTKLKPSVPELRQDEFAPDWPVGGELDLVACLSKLSAPFFHSGFFVSAKGEFDLNQLKLEKAQTWIASQQSKPSSP